MEHAVKSALPFLSRIYDMYRAERGKMKGTVIGGREDGARNKKDLLE